jgi:hypothetical protein
MSEMKREQRCVQLWSVLVTLAIAQRVASYNEISDITGIARGGLTIYLDPIYKFCKKNKLPILTSLVVNTVEGNPSHEVYDEQDISAMQRRVFVFDWLRWREKQSTPRVEELEELAAAELVA